MKTVTESLFLCGLTGHKINVNSIIAATKIKHFWINIIGSLTTFSLLDCTESYFQSRLSISHSGCIFRQCDQVRGKQPSFVPSATQSHNTQSANISMTTDNQTVRNKKEVSRSDAISSRCEICSANEQNQWDIFLFHVQQLDRVASRGTPRRTHVRFAVERS
jgi:hypothetical protein